MRSLCLLLLALAACTPPPPIDGRSAYATPKEPLASEWFRLGTPADDDKFHLVESIGKLPPAVRGDITYWSDRLLVEKARPLRQTGELEIAVYLSTNTAPDLVRFRYKVDGVELRVVESVDFTILWVGGPVRVETPADRLTRLHVAARSFLLEPWIFTAIAEQPRDATYSSAAAIDPWDMPSWKERADAGVMKGALYFLLFKRNPNRVGYHNLYSWFEQDFRKHFRW